MKNGGFSFNPLNLRAFSRSSPSIFRVVVAKMEAADPTVSIDLLVRSLVMLGAKPKDIARAIGG